MLLTIHDANLKKVAFVDNTKTQTLNFFNDQWHRSLQHATSTFTFSVFKKSLQYDTMISKTYNVLNERSFVSFRYKGRTYLFNVMEVKETEHVIECTAEYLSMELLNEYCGDYKSDKQMSFIEYMNLWGMVENNAIKIGINEVKDQKRTLEWTGEDTGLKRLLSIAHKFDAEIEFVTKLKPDSSLDAFVLNIYKANDGKDIQGVGKRRSDVLLNYGKNVAGISRTVDKTEIYNATMPIGTTSKTVDDPKKGTAAKQATTQTGYTGTSIQYAGKTLSKENLSKIVEHCRKNDLLISGVICQLYLESNWGNSNVAKMDNNWSGMSGGAQTRPSGVVVTTGSWRPANEGGTYMHYANLDDFFKDYTYLLAHQEIYAVKGKKDIEGYTNGLFRSGGARFDYAASGYGHYIGLMRSIRSGVNQANNGVLDKLDRGELIGNLGGPAEVSSATKDPRIDKMVQWFEARQGKVTYSMGARTGPGSYDCSSAIYYAMQAAGFPGIGTWPFSTETEHDALKRAGYQLVAENRQIPLQRGDILIWGKRGFSAGADGHTMIMKNNSDMIHCNFRHNGISTNNYQAYLQSMGRAIYTYVYRLPNQKGTAEVAPKVQAALRKADGLKNRSVGNGQCYGLAAWYARELGGPGLGAGFAMHDAIGDTMAAANIAEAYNWAKFGWKVVRGSGDIRGGGLYTVHANNAAAGTNIWGHVGIIKSVSGDKVTVLEQNYGGKQYVVQNTYSMATFKGFTKAVVYPPELAGGANINEAPKPAEPKKEEVKAETTTGTEVVEVKVDPKRYQEWKNEKGQVEFYLKNGVLYAPLSRDLYPSVLTGKETTDNWIRKDMKIETDSQDVLISSALRELRKHAYPKITYEVDGYVDLEIGDTVKIRDEGFTPTLILQARVSEQTISFTNPANNKTIFSNFVALENKVSKNLMTELEKMVEDARPYEIRLTTDNGVAFKNHNGSSLLTAQLFKGKTERQAIFLFKDLEDRFLGTNQQLEVKGSDVEDVLNVVVEAYVDNVLVAKTDISFTNAMDGAVGRAGEKGVDGRTPYFHTAWADSEDGRLNFTVEDSANKEYMGTYSDHAPEDSTDPGRYKWVKVKGDDGQDGQDGRGVVNYTNYYALTNSETGVSLPKGNLILDGDIGWASMHRESKRYQLAERLEPGKTYTLTIRWWRENTHPNFKPMIYYNGWRLQLAAPVNTSDHQYSSQQLIYNAEVDAWVVTFTVPSLHSMNENQRADFQKESFELVVFRHGTLASKDQNAANPEESYRTGATYANLVVGKVPLKGSVKADSQLGWSKDPQLVTPQKRFLWYYRQEEYSDGSIKTTEPILLAVHGEKGQDGRDGKNGADGRDGAQGPKGDKGDTGARGPQGAQGIKGDKGDKGDQGAVGPRGERGLQGLQGPQGEQGIPGEKGKDGRTQYTHIAYADTNLGGGFSQTTNGSKAYIGMYVDFEEADSPNPARYRWTLIKGDKGDKGDRGVQGLKGDQGVPGPKGADGRTPYFHIAYANSEDGRKDFSTTASNGRRFIGTVTDYNQADPTDPQAYRWASIVGDLDIGNYNHIRNGAFPKDNRYWTNVRIASHPFYYNNQKKLFLLETNKADEITSSSARFDVKRNTDYTLSFYAFASGNVSSSDVFFLGRKTGETRDFTVINQPIVKRRYSPHKAEYVTVTFNSGEVDNGYIRFDNNGSSNGQNSLLFFGEVMLVEGNAAQKWSPNQEDIDDEIAQKADAQLTIEQINRLNEQAGILIAELEAKASADIVAQWVETVKNQIKETERGKKETEQALISASQRIIALQQNMGDMQIRTEFMDTYFSQSQDGLILGKKDGSSAVRVSNDRISFVSAGKEVAFISQGVLQIDNGVFVKSLQVGRFRLEQHQQNLDMNVIRYVGGI
ncbi:phage tail protein [Streptococcus danieliae]|nr:phage tail protein [Streptococcus danieliae]